MTVVLDEERVISSNSELRGRLNLLVDTVQHAAAVVRRHADPETKMYVKEYEGVRLAGSLSQRTTLLVFVRENNGYIIRAAFVSAAWQDVVLK